MTMFKTTGALVLAAAALGAAGCAGGDDGGGSEQAQEGAGTSKVAEPAAEETTTSQGDAEPAPEEVLATREGKIDDLPVKLEITELTRSGDTVILGLSVAVTEGNSDENGADIFTAFDDGNLSDATATMDGITLIDSTNAKRYLVARDSDGACVCDDNLGSEFVVEDPPTRLSATYGAPPEDVDALDVEIPRFGVIRDVPIS